MKEGIVDHVGGLDETLAYVDEMELVKKAQPGHSGNSVYGELKREMWRETVELLENWAGEHVRSSKIQRRAQMEKEESLKRVGDWEKVKPKL